MAIIDFQVYPSSISHNSTTKHQLARSAATQPQYNNNLIHHHHHQHPLSVHRHHQARYASSGTLEKVRPSLITKIPLPPTSQTLRPPPKLTTPSLIRPRTQSSTKASTKSSLSSTHHHQGTWHIPINAIHQSSRTPSPSPTNINSCSCHLIGSIKTNLVKTIDGFDCTLEEKLTLVAQLHAEVEAEFTNLINSWFQSLRTLIIPIKSKLQIKFKAMLSNSSHSGSGSSSHSTSSTALIPAHHHPT
ncbi:hypothetical protein PSTT_02224 [Puccinia striiformis]|uniref:Uncharacterized protein n=1 Tax=Puccinia striiformis TaxID=27350 RepID=A0A2S4W0Q5_9BASI|nr:hypothetical protein PSTT_02224 [Puccinia striiformis]